VVYEKDHNDHHNDTHKLKWPEYYMFILSGAGKFKSSS